VSFDKKYWLLFALSPSGDAPSMILKWRKVADRHTWILAASKESKNGVPFVVGLGIIDSELREVKQRYPVDDGRVIFTGLSGGGMVSHAFAKFYPHLVSAVIINTGMMEQSFMTADYPDQKLAVFLASPTDFRYKEMHRDLAFLESHKWKTKWIEFPGGHRLAPEEVCEQAAQWLEENLGGW
jgi:predicted esterase